MGAQDHEDVHAVHGDRQGGAAPLAHPFELLQRPGDAREDGLRKKGGGGGLMVCNVRKSRAVPKGARGMGLLHPIELLQRPGDAGEDGLRAKRRG